MRYPKRKNKMILNPSKMPPKLMIIQDKSDKKIDSSSSTVSNSRTCTYIFARRNERCTNSLPEDIHQHGNDRYCSTCQSKEPIKSLLENEIEKRCEGHECNAPVLKIKQSPSVYGDDRFCKSCLANQDLVERLLLEKRLNEESNAKDGKAQERPSNNNDWILGEKYNQMDLHNMYESLGKPNFETKKVNHYLNSHVRYLIEVILRDCPVELAGILLWAATEAENNTTKTKTVVANKNWGAMNSKVLKGRLILLKREIVSRLVNHLKDIPFPSSKIKARNEIIQQLRDLECDLRHEVIDIFECELEERRLANNPLSRFVADMICITGKKTDKLFTQAIFDAFVKWIEQQADKETMLSSSSQIKLSLRSDTFGKALKKHIEEETKDEKPIWTIGKYGPKTCHFGIRLKIKIDL